MPKLKSFLNIGQYVRIVYLSGNQHIEGIVKEVNGSHVVLDSGVIANLLRADVIIPMATPTPASVPPADPNQPAIPESVPADPVNVAIVAAAPEASVGTPELMPPVDQTPSEPSA